MLVVLRLPHLVLPNISNDDGLRETTCIKSFTPDVVDDMGCIKMAIVAE